MSTTMLYSSYFTGANLQRVGMKQPLRKIAPPQKKIKDGEPGLRRS